MKLTLHVDGQARTVQTDDADTPLLYILRDQLGLNNPHFGCGLAQCGACTVHLDGRPTRSCIYPISDVGDSKVTTLAGIGTPGHPHPIQQAMLEEQAFFCGYCLNGWVMTAAALVRDNPKAGDAEIREAMADLKCRCGSHMSILRAIKRVTGAA